MGLFYVMSCRRAVGSEVAQEARMTMNFIGEYVSFCRGAGLFDIQFQIVFLYPSISSEFPNAV